MTQCRKTIKESTMVYSFMNVEIQHNSLWMSQCGKTINECTMVDVEILRKHQWMLQSDRAIKECTMDGCHNAI